MPTVDALPRSPPPLLRFQALLLLLPLLLLFLFLLLLILHGAKYRSLYS